MANPARAQLTDLMNLGPAQSRIAPFVAANPTAVQQFLNTGSDYLDGFLTAQYTLPLVAPYPQDVIDFEVIWASYRILMRLGFDPRSPVDQLVKQQYDEKIEWAKSIGKQEMAPNMSDSSVDGAEGGPFVISSTTRGYSDRGYAQNWPTNIKSDPFSGD